MSVVIDFLKDVVTDLMTFDDIASVYLNGIPQTFHSMIEATLVISAAVGFLVVLIKIK